MNKTLISIFIVLAVLTGFNTFMELKPETISVGGSTSDNWNVGGNLTVTGTSAFTGNASLSGTLTVSGISSVDKLYEGSGVLSTTTPASMTLAASDIQGYSVIEMNPTVSDITVTMPASSTLTTFIPTAGQIGRFFFQNSTTTNGIDITLASGTGVYVNTGSTTKAVNYNNYAVYLECMRKSNSDIYCWLNN